MDTKTLNELKQAIRNSSLTTKIYIGCDSKRNSKGSVKYATVVVLHINGKNGGQLFSFITNEQEYNKPQSPKMRLLNEAYKAVEIATQIIDDIGDRHFELHLDLNTNPKHKSNLAVKEALGFVLGSLGINAKLKPHAFAASCAADKLAG